MGKRVHFFSNKVVLTALLLLALCVGVWLYFFVREGEKRHAMNAMRAIPSNAAFAVRVNDFSKLVRKTTSESELAQLLHSDAATTRLRQVMLYVVDTMAEKNTVVGDLSRQPVWISAHVFGKDLSFLYSLNLPDNLYLNNVKQLVPLLESDGYTVVEQPYDDEKIFTFRRGKVEVFHAATVRRVLVVSASRVLVEMAIRQAKSPASLADNPAFVQAAQTAGAHEDANLYISHQQLPRLLENYLNGAYPKPLNFLKQLGSFVVLDAALHPDAVLFSGFLFSENFQNSYFSILSNQSSKKLTSFDILPRATDGALCMGITNAKQLVADYGKFCEYQQPGSTQRKAKLDQLRKRTGVDAAAFFCNLHPSELTLARVPIVNVESKDTWFLALKSSNVSAAHEAVKAGIAHAAVAEGKPIGSYERIERMGNGEQLSVYRNPTPGLIAALQGSLFTQCEDTYLTFIGDYIIYSSSPAAVKEFALLAILKKTLAQTGNLSDYTATESNMLIYVNPSRSDAVALSLLKPALQGKLSKSPMLGAFQCVGLQLRAMSDKVYCNAFLKTTSKAEEMQRQQGMLLDFEVKLDAPLQMAPWVVINHKTRKKEILAQDIQNTVYLFDNRGVLLWKNSTIGEAIMGRVQQVDYLKNNKLQLLFNTKSKLYIIDRLGRNVERFPIKFSSPASAPVAAFDYDRSRDYRYFVPCKDGKIRPYERNGNPLTGFAPALSFGSITQPLQHVRIKDKDYIVVADNRSIYILNRKGEKRVHLKESVAPVYGSSITAEVNSEGSVVRMVTTTAGGDLAYIYFDGSVERLPLKPKPSEHHFFRYFGEGGKATCAVADGKYMHVYEANNLKLKFSHTFDYPLNAAPEMFTPLPNLNLYSVYVESEQRAYLMDENGDMLNGFPRSAVAPLLVDNLRNDPNAYNVLTCDENGFLTCFSVSAR
ncbi:MAG: DUF3352 domain-containing protein [Prevotellaceae bacterium]|jgi:hypothetical protein|nr:DUF3352 domain-containing protein [Prevotellaceae bacterium]